MNPKLLIMRVNYLLSLLFFDPFAPHAAKKAAANLAAAFFDLYRSLTDFAKDVLL